MASIRPISPCPATLGSDAGGVPIFFHGENGQELEYMVKFGLKPFPQRPQS